MIWQVFQALTIKGTKDSKKYAYHPAQIATRQKIRGSGNEENCIYTNSCIARLDILVDEIYREHWDAEITQRKTIEKDCTQTWSRAYISWVKNIEVKRLERRSTSKYWELENTIPTNLIPTITLKSSSRDLFIYFWKSNLPSGPAIRRN